jgi:hypothetical protein
MRSLCAGLAALALAACSDLASSTDTVVALQVTAPPGSIVEVGDTVQYTVVALNKDGDQITAPIVWSTPDTTIAAVDSVSGVVLGRLAGQARIQATSGGLVSPLNILTVVASADTLILVPPDTVVVDTTTATTTPPLVARLEAFNPPDSIAGRPIFYELVDPVFPDTASRTVQFSNGGLADTAITGTNGEPQNPVTFARIPGVTPPDSAIIEIRSLRYKDTQLVPGSGQRWIVRFGP